jgi:hypothetical protein
MSGQQFAWWTYVRNMMRQYQKHKGRSDLNRVELLEVQAVNKAIEQTAEKPDGQERLELIRRVYWRRNRVTLNRAAMDIYISYSTAKRWHYDFCLLVAEAFGLYEPEEE